MQRRMKSRFNWGYLSQKNLNSTTSKDILFGKRLEENASMLGDVGRPRLTIMNYSLFQS